MYNYSCLVEVRERTVIFRLAHFPFVLQGEPGTDGVQGGLGPKGSDVRLLLECWGS